MHHAIEQISCLTQVKTAAQKQLTKAAAKQQTNDLPEPVHHHQAANMTESELCQENPNL